MIILRTKAERLSMIAVLNRNTTLWSINYMQETLYIISFLVSIDYRNETLKGYYMTLFIVGIFFIVFGPVLF
ncbi:hypothetical protein LMANV2_80033 [Leptospira interrogans serovar Manilae]|uniref:Uncharacterized protein n=1 Tax=Leptospira interrogans serovar Manilae TaxID=214675 RepID=A0AAQ1P189_LEPIR|nr:hypothetical protein LMANV2_80033 [Leptospira interrogans serovar Manilae]